MSMYHALQQMIQPLSRRVVGLVQRATLIRQQDNRLQVWGTEGDLKDGVEQFGQLGIKVVPLPGAEAIVVAIGGDASHRVVIATRDESREPDVGEPGDVLIYHLTSPTRIWMRADGSVYINGPLIADEIRDAHGSLAELRQIYNAHGHPPAAPGKPIPPAGL